MIRKIKKQEKGITLIALVITIIVLLILAGVAISMLSGENGILTRASEAKKKTEEAQIEEAGALFSYEMALKQNSKYNLQYGYLTGFEYDEEQNHAVETVEEVEAELPEGYKIISKYKCDNMGKNGKDVPLNDEEKNSTYISTGMVIAKDGQEVARTVLFGDVSCDGRIVINDANAAKRYVKYWKGYDFTNFQKIACNVISDIEINFEDSDLLDRYVSEHIGIEINQQQKIVASGKNLKRLYTELQQYISLLKETETGYKFEYNEENDTYKLKGVKEGTTVETLISKLPDIYEVKIIEQTINEENTLIYNEIASDAQVMNGYYIQISFIDEDENSTEKVRFAYIEVEK